MKALILDGSGGEEQELLSARLTVETSLKETGWDVSSIILRDRSLASCRGCFGCWIKTPGVCVIDDLGRDIVRYLIQSDLLVLISPVTFGGYSSLLKRAVERFIPILLPFFRSIDGTIHHQLRYARYPKLLVTGYQREPNPKTEEVFRNMVLRNVINGLGSSYKIAMLYHGQSDADISAAIKALIKGMEFSHA